MNRVIVIEFITLDGVVEDPDGSGGTPGGGWAFRYGPEVGGAQDAARPPLSVRPPATQISFCARLDAATVAGIGPGRSAVAQRAVRAPELAQRGVGVEALAGAVRAPRLRHHGCGAPRGRISASAAFNGRSCDTPS
jgi:hypothetical protein